LDIEVAGLNTHQEFSPLHVIITESVTNYFGFVSIETEMGYKDSWFGSNTGNKGIAIPVGKAK
jgi:hypothetical protein